MRRRIICWAVSIGLGLGLTTSCKRPPDSTPPRQLPPARLSVGLESLAALALIAHEAGYFEHQGLALSATGFPSGRLALGALLKGDVDLAVCADTPFVLESFSRRDLRLVAIIGTSDNELKLVAHPDSGIREVADLRGRRVATQKGSSLHFFLHLALLKHGLSERDVELTFAAPDALPGLLREKRVDAVALREPLISRDLSASGNPPVVLQEPGLFVKYYGVVTTAGFVVKSADTLARFIKALVDAEELADADNGRASRIVSQRLSLPDEVYQPVWRTLDLRVSLPQSVLLDLEDQARWAVSSKLVEAGSIPNYLDLIHDATLRALKPAAVSIIR